MADLRTTCRAPHLPHGGLSHYGRHTRETMIAAYREHYQRQLEQALAALAVPDEALVVETRRGSGKPTAVPPAADDLAAPRAP